MKKFSVLCLILAIVMVMTGTARANYLLNPGFEDADPEPNNWVDPCVPEPNEWDFWAEDTGTLESTATYIEGDAAGAHGGEDYAELNVYTYGRTFVFQQLYVAEDIVYTLTAWARANAYTMPAPTELKIEFYDWNNGLMREDIENIDVPLTWTQYTNDSNGGIAAPIGTRRITSTGVNLIDYAILYYDDFDLTSTPDYSSLDDCQKTQFIEEWDFVQGDLTRDCFINLRDIAVFALHWTECNIDPTFGGCSPQ